MINFSLWKITMPYGADKPVELFPAKPDGKFFIQTVDGFDMIVPQTGVTTPNTKYPRCELREMTSKDKAAWSLAKGAHVMEWEGSIDALPTEKPEMVFGQIHDSDDDVFRIKYAKNDIFALYKDKNIGTLVKNYKLGTLIRFTISVNDGTVVISADEKLNGGDSKRVAYKPTKKHEGCYFKVGAYPQGLKGTSKVHLKRVFVSHIEDIKKPIEAYLPKDTCKGCCVCM